MPLPRKAFALSLGVLGLLTAATLAQAQRGPQGDGQTLVIEDANIDYLLKSEVAAHREGVIDRMELRIGMEVAKRGQVIGYLHKEEAELTVVEAKIQAEAKGATLKADAQKWAAAAVVNRNRELLKRGQGYVSSEEVQKGEAEYAVADSSWIEALDTQKLAVAKMRSAEQALKEHTIVAPFAGVIIEEYKHAGESVRANEAVVKLGNLERLRVHTYIPVEYAYRVAVGTDIEIQPRLGDGPRTGKHPIEQKKFRGKVTFVDPSLQAIGESGVRVYAEIDNPGKELRPGLKATMTFYLEPETTKALAVPAPAIPTNVGIGQNDLPALPR